MHDPIDAGLGRLRAASSDLELDGLESAVFARASAGRADAFGGRALQVQIAVTCGALLIGLAVAQLVSADPQPIRSEAVVLSDDSVFAPSIQLGGGA